MLVFNPVQLIEEVQKRPGLYKPDHPSDREEKLALWKEIGAVIFHDWDTCNKATAYDRAILSRRSGAAALPDRAAATRGRGPPAATPRAPRSQSAPVDAARAFPAQQTSSRQYRANTQCIVFHSPTFPMFT
ncbi:hypothetical protein K1T71_011481 [Dendrolimus kikuchii]|uniref:Uncharacterized protein n=1 Tax=Dendrolimus kikuchii TaxID=765133 RepID=A0ACC1CP62_9NEOP|nr:hypothetical protein K1T71_011481 [Dendrolimus kikuchii]